MNTASASLSTILRRGSLLRVRARPGVLVRCIRGMVWLTQENDPADRVLCAGEVFRFDRPGMALANALGADAALEFSEEVAYEHAAASTRKPGASVCDEILRVCTRYDPQAVVQLPIGQRIELIEQEARRMRGQVLWLLWQGLQRGILRSLTCGWSVVRSCCGRAWRISMRKSRRASAEQGL